MGELNFKYYTGGLFQQNTSPQQESEEAAKFDVSD